MIRSRRGLTTTAAALTSMTLLLTAGCGSDSSADDDLAGVGTGADRDDDGATDDGGGDPKPHPGDNDTIDRPDVTLPDYMANEFGEAGTDDAVALAVIYDAQQRRNATDLAIDRQDPELDALAFYNDGDGLIAALEYIGNAVSYGTTWTGTTRFYQWEVSVDEDDPAVAALTYCMDENEAFEMDPGSGEITERPASDDGFVQVRERVRKNDTGVWQRSYVTSDRGAEQCLN